MTAGVSDALAASSTVVGTAASVPRSSNALFDEFWDLRHAEAPLFDDGDGGVVAHFDSVGHTSARHGPRRLLPASWGVLARL